ncbi:hypothetical protein [Arenibaculum pallidiluteum]|uniref:hypothetical protein n=1 Tax=Arenibaculum pallidiluteum TaxID=2812559 RepID=UPI001A96BF1B|nr:hypothetical protein [Arenibaculum pallidiluteum]
MATLADAVQRMTAEATAFQQKLRSVTAGTQAVMDFCRCCRHAWESDDLALMLAERDRLSPEFGHVAAAS